MLAQRGLARKWTTAAISSGRLYSASGSFLPCLNLLRSELFQDPGTHDRRLTALTQIPSVATSFAKQQALRHLHYHHTIAVLMTARRVCLVSDSS